MFPGSSCHTWIETDGSNWFIVGLRMSYLVLINTLWGITDGAEPVTIYIVGVSYGSYIFIGWSAQFVADCSMKHNLANLCLIHCTCWDNYPYMMCNLISKNLEKEHCPLFIPRSVNMLNIVLISLWIGSVGFLTMTLPKIRFWQGKWAQNYMGACFQAPRAAPRQRLMEMHHVH